MFTECRTIGPHFVQFLPPEPKRYPPLAFHFILILFPHFATQFCCFQWTDFFSLHKQQMKMRRTKCSIFFECKSYKLKNGIFDIVHEFNINWKWWQRFCMKLLPINIAIGLGVDRENTNTRNEFQTGNGFSAQFYSPVFVWNGKNEEHLFLDDLILQFIPAYIYACASFRVRYIIDRNWIFRLTIYFWCCILVGMLFTCK